MSFNDELLVWLRDPARRPDAAVIERAETDSTDWEGDTEGGFYCRFDMTIHYRNEAGEQRRYSVGNGEELGDLWDWLIARWPS